MKKWSLPIGLMISDVIASFFKKPITRQYPFERNEAPEQFRGKLVWNLEKCTGCMLCVKDCPARAIELVVVDRAAKRFILRFREDRCTYCSQCVINCRQGCLQQLSTEWELASLTKAPFTVYYGRQDDVDAQRELDEDAAEA